LRLKLLESPKSRDNTKKAIMLIKSNRKVTLSLADKQQDRFVSVDTLELEGHASLEVHLKSVDFPLMLVKQVFVNDDDSVGGEYAEYCVSPNVLADIVRYWVFEIGPRK
jgi:hypothetical protein